VVAVLGATSTAVAFRQGNPLVSCAADASNGLEAARWRALAASDRPSPTETARPWALSEFPPTLIMTAGCDCIRDSTSILLPATASRALHGKRARAPPGISSISARTRRVAPALASAAVLGDQPLAARRRVTAFSGLPWAELSASNVVLALLHQVLS
jgi:hypothetical protein